MLKSSAVRLCWLAVLSFPVVDVGLVRLLTQLHMSLLPKLPTAKTRDDQSDFGGHGRNLLHVHPPIKAVFPTEQVLHIGSDAQLHMT